MPIQKNNLVRFQFYIVLVGSFLLIIKFWAFWITNSNTILTDALESIVNVVAGGLGLYSLAIAAIPRDTNHPYGHGKVEFISAGVEGTLITVAGLAIVLKSIQAFFYPPEIQKIDIGLVLTSLAGIVNYIMGFSAERKGRANNSMALIASGEHLKSDAYSTVGLIIGLAAIYFTNWVWLDALIALFFGLVIGVTGCRLVRSSIGGIMDEVDQILLQELVTLLQKERQANWIDIHNLRIIKYGGSLHIDCHLTVPRFFNVEEAHSEVDKLEEVLENNYGEDTELFIHVDPCIPECCHLCPRENCPMRTSPFLALEEWTAENITRNRKHGIKDTNTKKEE